VRTAEDVAIAAQDAEARIRPHIRHTLLDRTDYLSRLGGANVYCKLENLQYGGAFKLRGAMNKLLSLTSDQLAQGVITASSGNHGAAVARSVKTLGATATVFVPEDASPAKIDAIERLGAAVHLHGNDCTETEAHARQHATEYHMVYVPPYNDPEVIGGQATIGIELATDLDTIGAVFVPLGGGGLISGIAGYLKSVNPKVEIIGCSPENSQVMMQSVKAGKIIDAPSLPTLSDGTAGGVEPNAITFGLCQSLVDGYETVTEDEIRGAIVTFLERQRLLIEGAAATAIAAYTKTHKAYPGKNIVLIISGSNISLDTLNLSIS
jgi:threonine dehydratase